MENVFPTYKRLTDKKAIKAARKPYCERCGARASGEPHHVITRGAGGPDHPFNLIQLCGPNCHYGDVPAGKVSKQELFEIIAKREGVPVQDVIDTVRRLQRGLPEL